MPRGKTRTTAQKTSDAEKKAERAIGAERRQEKLWDNVMQAAGVSLGAFVGAFFGYLLGRIDVQIQLIQTANAYRHLYNISNPLLPTLIVDNEYYVGWIIAELTLNVILFFMVFSVLWFGRPRTRPVRIFALFVVMTWFLIPIATFAYPLVTSQNVFHMEVPSSIGQSDSAQIDSAVIRLDAFRPFAVYFHDTTKLLFFLVFLLLSGWLSTALPWSKTKRAILAVVFTLAGFLFYVIPLVEERFVYNGSFSIMEGSINVIASPSPYFDLLLGFFWLAALVFWAWSLKQSLSM